MRQDFNTIPIKKLVLRLGLPAMAAQFFNILYSIVDRIYVGKIPGSGSLALASIGVCAPALSAISAFAFMVGIGGASAMSIAMGQKKTEQAQKMINNAFLLLLIFGILVPAAILPLKQDILYLLGCSDNMYPYADSYFTIYVCGTMVALLGMGMNQFILAQGYAHQGMLSIMIGAISNVILDPIFIFGLDMGISGAALATVLSQVMAMGYVLLFLLRKEGILRIRFYGYHIKAIVRIISIGFMSFLIVILNNLIIILLNATLRKYGGVETGDLYIACAAIVQSFMVIIAFPAQGITTGCGTLFSYHYGAGNYKKIMQTFRYVFVLCAGFIAFLLLLIQLIPQVFVGLFVNETDNIALASLFLRRYTYGIIGVAVQFAIVDGLTAMGKIRFAMPLSLLRKLIYVLCVMLIPLFLPLENIFFAGTISDLMGALFTITIFGLVVTERLKQEIGQEREGLAATQTP